MRKILLIGLTILTSCSESTRDTSEILEISSSSNSYKLSLNDIKIDSNSPQMAAKFFTFESHGMRECIEEGRYRNIQLYYEVEGMPTEYVPMTTDLMIPKAWLGQRIDKAKVSFYQFFGERQETSSCIWKGFAFNLSAPENCHITEIKHNGEKDMSVFACIGD